MMEDFSLPMDEEEISSDKGSNGRTILHFDIDCFYAQVEMIKDPSLKSRPLGIQQKNIVVTCNYVAREMGVVKCSFISDARKACPALVLVNGEDLAEYRRYSQKIFETIKELGQGCPVERLGMDENFIDVTKLVLDHESEEKITGHTYGKVSGNNDSSFRRLKIGSKIAQEIRNEIIQRFGITTSCGISWNKLLSKIVGSQNKPNNQTTLLPNYEKDLVFELKSLKKIPGIGSTTFKRLQEYSLNTPEDVWSTSSQKLLQIFPESPDLVLKIQQLCEGIDYSVVKESNDKPLSIGLEDRFRPLSSEVEVEGKMIWLLNRLAKLLQEDGRLPRTFKVTVRDALKDQLEGKHKFHKESRQCKINPKLFGNVQNQKFPLDNKQDIVMIGLSLARKMIDFNAEFKLTLLGVSVTDFVLPGKSIMSFFKGGQRKPGSTSSGVLTNKCSQEQDICDIVNDRSVIQKQSKPPVKSENFSIDDEVDGVSTSGTKISDNSSELNIKNEIQNDIKIAEIPDDCDPEIFSQLPIDIQQELLNTNRISNPAIKDKNELKHLSSPIKPSNFKVPDEWDNDVFQGLPEDIKSELLSREKNSASSSKGLKRSQNRIDHYFTKKLTKTFN